MSSNLEVIFNPRSIAIIGATEVSGKAGERRTRSLLEGGFEGEIYLINPKRETIFERKAYKSILDVEEKIDLCMIVISPKLVPAAVAESAAKGAKAVIIISSGFGETGAEGKELEKEILDIAKKNSLSVIGPNCSGIFNSVVKMNILGIPEIRKGNISVIAQSGNVIDSLCHYAAVRSIGFSKIISVGNAIDVRFHEYLDYLGQDPSTEVILLYMEGIKDGAELIRVARSVSKQKPIIAIKAGKTKAGARAAASHTGSLAGEYAVAETALKQAGILLVSDVDEMFAVAQVFLKMPLPAGRTVAVMSEGGGDNSIAADNLEKQGLVIPVLSDEAQNKIKPLILNQAASLNPIDYGGTAEENPIVIAECCEICMQEQEIDSVFISGFFGGFKEIITPLVEPKEIETAEKIVKLVAEYQKPVILHSGFADQPYESLEILKRSGIPVFSSCERASRVLSYLFGFSENKQKPLHQHNYTQERVADVENIIKRAFTEGRKNLLETEARQILELAGVPLLPARFAQDEEKAVEAAEEIGYPLAMKVICPDIIHKTEAGGVKLNLKSRQDVITAFSNIKTACKGYSPHFKGVILMPMANRGEECIVGMSRDSSFGPVLMFGLGGIFVEILKDVSFRIAPLSEEESIEMISEPRSSNILKGARGRNRKDLDTLKKIVLKMSEIAINYPEIKEIDLNPVIVHDEGEGASIVDCRFVLAETQRPEGGREQ